MTNLTTAIKFVAGFVIGTAIVTTFCVITASAYYWHLSLPDTWEPTSRAAWAYSCMSVGIGSGVFGVLSNE